MTSVVYRIPRHVEFPSWSGGDEWVVYHTGTGETLRLSNIAMALLEIISRQPCLDRAALVTALSSLFSDPVSDQELDGAMDGLLDTLLKHECIESLPCG